MKRGRRGEGEKGRQKPSAVFALSLALSFSPSPLLPFSPSPLPPFSAKAAHKYHFSFAQIEYNAKEKTAEIILRVFTDDLEAALSQRSNKSVKLDHKDAAVLVAAYAREKLELKGRDGRIKRLTWIGMETKVDLAVLYLEAKMPEGITGTQLRFWVLFEMFDDQVNQVLLKTGNNKTSLAFKAGDGFKPLSFKATP